jgi:hypothetical protein
MVKQVREQAHDAADNGGDRVPDGGQDTAAVRTRGALFGFVRGLLGRGRRVMVEHGYSGAR